MANPQKEDGHTPIANEIMGAFMKTNFSKYERRVLDCVLRKTYGWNKKTDRISYTQFEEATGLKRWHIARALKNLIARNVVIVLGEGYKLEYGLQKNYDLWKPLPEQVTKSLPEQVTKSLPLQEESLPEQVINNEIKSLPLQEESLPLQEKPLPEQVTKSLPLEVNTNTINIIQKHITKAYNKIMKQKYGQFLNVLLTTTEYEKLVARFGKDGADSRIEKLSEGIASKGYRYKSAYATILVWDRNGDKKKNSFGQKEDSDDKPIKGLKVERFDGT